jgi:uncharacterized protein (TIGR00375 family)
VLVAADLHIHSRFSRATSKDLTIPTLAQWASRKGLAIVGTGDFTHPQWIAELAENLEETGTGWLRPRSDLLTEAQGDTLDQQVSLDLFDEHNRGIDNSELQTDGRRNFILTPDEVRFVLSSEVSCIYKDQDKTRKIHLVLLAPSFAIVRQINTAFAARGNIASDGRPIFGLSAREVCELVWNVSADVVVIPAHIWTPWFSLFGSQSGYDTIEDCFGEYTDRIFALETGLSSDPRMNWQCSALDRFALVSNSDAHSPSRLGREANVFSIRNDQAPWQTDDRFGYHDMVKALRQVREKQTSVSAFFAYTVEFFPEEGKYHLDGHRDCHIVWHPDETAQHEGVCPVCGREVTIGVLNRVEKLSDREPLVEGKVPFKSTIPLEELIADVVDKSPGTQAVQRFWQRLVSEVGSEYFVLLEASENEIAAASSHEIAAGVMRMRQGRVQVEPGYDGEFGKVHVKTIPDNRC